MNSSKEKGRVKDYHDIIIKCMVEFQHIEEMIKMILRQIETIIYNRLKGYAYYDPEIRKNSINDSAMGRLIQMLNAFTNDKDLIVELNRIKVERDRVAHKSLLLSAKDLEDDHTFHLGLVDLEKLHLSSQISFTKLHKMWVDCNKSAIKIIAEQAYDKKDETT